MDLGQQKLIAMARNNDIRATIIREGYKDTETIAQRLGISRQTAKQHLTILKRCGLVSYRNDFHISEMVVNGGIKVVNK